MNSTRPLYTNEVSQDYFRECDQQPFTEEQLASFNEKAREHVQQQQVYLEKHPPIAIYRLATEGSQTRDGGVIESASAGHTIGLDNGQLVRVAQKGDNVVYADGSTAKIVTGAGESNSNIVLVGSRLCRLNLSVRGLEYQHAELPRLLVALWPSALELTQEVRLAARAEN
jgi:hypothetical protein